MNLSEQQIALRLETARSGLAGYRRFLEELEYRISAEALADLVTSAEWLIELLEAGPCADDTVILPRPAGDPEPMARRYVQERPEGMLP